jgi:hypothetical protein
VGLQVEEGSGGSESDGTQGRGGPKNAVRGQSPMVHNAEVGPQVEEGSGGSESDGTQGRGGPKNAVRGQSPMVHEAEVGPQVEEGSGIRIRWWGSESDGTF